MSKAHRDTGIRPNGNIPSCVVIAYWVVMAVAGIIIGLVGIAIAKGGL